MTSAQSLDLISPMQAMAREAGSLLMDYFRQRVKIEYKGAVDLVTLADRKSEALILERIRKQFPTHDGMGEEGSRIETCGEYKRNVAPLDRRTTSANAYRVCFDSRVGEPSCRRSAGET